MSCRQIRHYYIIYVLKNLPFGFTLTLKRGHFRVSTALRLGLGVAEASEFALLYQL